MGLCVGICSNFHAAILAKAEIRKVWRFMTGRSEGAGNSIDSSFSSQKVAEVARLEC